jgi:hypothetical protein
LVKIMFSVQSGITGLYRVVLQACTEWHYRLVQSGITGLYRVALQTCTEWHYRLVKSGITDSEFSLHNF